MCQLEKSSRGLMAKVLNGDVKENEFELQSRYYDVYFQKYLKPFNCVQTNELWLV